jgi:hypothetical protein
MGLTNRKAKNFMMLRKLLMVSLFKVVKQKVMINKDMKV